jgi:hypothetical protein
MTMTSMTDRGAGQGSAVRLPEAGLDPGGLLVTWPVHRTGSHRVAADATAQSSVRQRSLTPDEVGTVLSLAARAPSLHNSQPWLFRAREDCIELLADPHRMLRRVDPDGRELIISCGAALFGLRLGLRRIGRLPAVDLLPDSAQPWLVARVWPAGHAARTRVEADLIAAVPHRHTHRGPFSPGEVPDRLLAAMVTDAAAEGSELLLISDRTVIARLDRLVRGAAAQQRSDPEMTAELARWVRLPHSQARDGVPATARLTGRASMTHPGAALDSAARQWVGHRQQQATRASLRLAGRDFGPPGTEHAGGHPPSATAVLLTAGDTPADWLRAGQALDRLLLRAAARWVFAELQSQPLESRQHRSAVRALLGGQGYPQMVMQFGRANTAVATPRRPHAEMLTTD